VLHRMVMVLMALRYPNHPYFMSLVLLHISVMAEARFFKCDEQVGRIKC